MGERRLSVRAREREREAVNDGPAKDAKPGEHKGGDNNLPGRILSMQRTYGNAAVTSVVQRKGDRPQSTDAPGAKKDAPSEDYAPKSRNEKFIHEDDDALLARANQDLEGTKNDIGSAAERFEELWFRHQDRAYAVGPWKAYSKLHDDKRASFWRKVMSGEIKPGHAKDTGPGSQHA